MNIAIVGGSGGIGQAFAKALAADHTVQAIYATFHRTQPTYLHPKVTWHSMGITKITPGTTDTALSKPFQGNVTAGKLFSAGSSAGRMIDLMKSLSPEKTERFWAYDGARLPGCCQ